ncbi:Ribokinase-like protein [Limtongia smithiae]|uniref:Ribokinase-like protein n=1 Tax=Limtongia smithiae TaxID=1125753 RepID=UPI0034CD6212
MPHVTVLGSLNYDLVVTTPVVPRGGETLHASSFATHRGGKGANQALATARAAPKSHGVKVRMVGRVGTDQFGAVLKSGLAGDGVDVSRVGVVDGASGVAVIIVEHSGENRILVCAGANDSWTPADITNSLLELDDGILTDVLVLQNELPLAVVHSALALAHSLDVTVAYNPSPIAASTSEELAMQREMLRDVVYLLVNESELQLLLGDVPAEHTTAEAMLSSAMRLQHEMAPKSTVIVTLGGQGVIYALPGTAPVLVPPYKPARVVDTTGAGDSFLGGFVGAVAAGKQIADAVRWGAAAGSIAVTRAGAEESIPFAEEIIRVVSQV